MKTKVTLKYFVSYCGLLFNSFMTKAVKELNLKNALVLFYKNFYLNSLFSC